MYHLFFEQSGTFKREFAKMGIHAEDYDILNDFGETDHVIDLYAEINRAFEGGGFYIRQYRPRSRPDHCFLPLH